MPALAKIDIIDGSGYYRDDTIERVRRVAIVTGVSTADPASVTYLATQTPGLPQIGDQHPTRPKCYLRRVASGGIADGDDTLKLFLDYESGPALQFPGGGSSPWVLEDDTGVTLVSTQFVPGSNKRPLLVTYMDSREKKYEYQATVDIAMPTRVLTLTGSVGPGVNLNAVRAAVGYVNDAEWSGKPIGYWKFDRLKTRVAANGEVSSVIVQLSTKNTEDWSEYRATKDRNTDQFFRLNPSKVTALENTAYQHGIQYPDGKNDGGIIKIGPYPTTSFFSVFGV